MTRIITYQVGKAQLSQGKMQVTVVNLYPQYSDTDRKQVETDIEKKLFSVFSKYRQ